MAVAENQPFKNRMSTTSFPEISAPLRALSDEEFQTRALRLFAFQFLNNRAYSRFCASRRLDPGNVQKWQDIPAAPTVAFKELELSCVVSEDRTAVFHSSGTTEQRPSRHFHSAESLEIYEESLLIGFRQNVMRDGPVRIVALTPSAEEAPHSSLVHMFETVGRQAGSANVVFVGTTAASGDWILEFDKAVAEFEQASRKDQPVCILGTAFLFVHLIDFLRERKHRIDLPVGSVVMETGGYKGRSRSIPRSELHAMICDCFSITQEQIVCEYGMSELSSQAYARASGVEHRVGNDVRVFHFPGWCRVQIISPETGQEVAEGGTGLIRVFDLANVYSVMAVQTEDLGIKRGSGFELSGRAALSEPRGCSLMAL
jgi:phenylacetate-coenzyme A ligase PaaK-like adenylate-forming protein